MAARKRSELRKLNVTGPKGVRHPVKHLEEREKELKKMIGKKATARKTVKRAKASPSNSRSSPSNGKAGAMSNEDRLAKDIADEIRPFTNILSDAALKLKTELDKKGP